MSDEPRTLQAHIDEVLARRAERPPEQLTRDAGHCGIAHCRCTHTDPCDHGWIAGLPRIDQRTGISYEQVEPCPICRTDAADRWAAKLRGESRNTRP